MLEATLKLLAPKAGESYLDLTAGYGGHASAFINATGDPSRAVLVDRDDRAVQYLRQKLGRKPRILHTDFLSAAKQLTAEGKQFDIVLADLGVSSPQLDEPERGFSFQREGPLDMRMDRRQALRAEDIVNRYPATRLAELIRRYGGEKPSAAGKIARAIAGQRPFSTTRQLALEIERVLGGPRSKINPATRTFQALRIATNQELVLLERLLPYLTDLLKPGGRVGLISFHSLEDRLVKRFLSEAAAAGYETSLRLLCKKPITPGPDELVYNPRARSAKLRAAVKIKTKGLEDADQGRQQVARSQSHGPRGLKRQAQAKNGAG